MASKTKWIVGVALVASLGSNVFLLRRLRHGADDVPPPKVQAAAPRADNGAWRADLERCRADGRKLLARTIATSAPMTDAGAASAPTSDARGGASPLRQREALCEIARDHLRATWQAQKDGIMQGVAADLADPNKQAEEGRKTTARMAETLGLTPGQADGLTADYLHIRGEHVTGLLAAIRQDPPDYETMLGEVKGLYADEDAMVGRLRGDAAVEQWRAHEIQGRTAIVTLAATFADAPWDDTIVW
jgi:hypothetical protein